MRAAIVSDPRRGDVGSHQRAWTGGNVKPGWSRDKAPAAVAAGACPPRHGGVRAARYCFLVSEGFSVVLGASTLTAAPLPASVFAAPVGATGAGAAAFGSTFLASLSVAALLSALASAGLVAGWVALVEAAG